MSKRNNKKRAKEVDWSTDEYFEKTRSMIYIEHSLECPIYTMKADEFLKYMQDEVPDRQFVLVRNNYGKTNPRPGSFEIQFSQNARTSKHDIWSGLDKGPPRRDKFPRFDKIMPDMQKVLKKFYVDKSLLDDEDVPEVVPNN